MMHAEGFFSQEREPHRLGRIIPTGLFSATISCIFAPDFNERMTSKSEAIFGKHYAPIQVIKRP